MSIKVRRLAAQVLVLGVLTLALLVVTSAPAAAITMPTPDGDRHPNVGAIVVRDPELGLLQWCSGTLIAKKVFLTASHCTAPLDDFLAARPGADVVVTFDEVISEKAKFYAGTWITNPNFNGFQGPGGSSDPGDVAVILLSRAPKIDPARLPMAGLLNELQAAHLLKDTRFTAVGYGTIRLTNTTGFHGILENLYRNFAEQGFLSLTDAWLNLPMTFPTGDGGTCYGDSGGPHFIHLDGAETDIVASITVTGDAPCVATDKTYRMDSTSAREFLGGYVDLP